MAPTAGRLMYREQGYQVLAYPVGEGDTGRVAIQVKSPRDSILRSFTASIERVFWWERYLGHVYPISEAIAEGIQEVHRRIGARAATAAVLDELAFKRGDSYA